ncbi:transposase [Streptobacillus felis]|uniref:transposase n=2 Tax=Streptobacillus felis TaxID=1384509 RepID=UPI00082C5DB2|nr:transposase [Streptobacillus felis]
MGRKGKFTFEEKLKMVKNIKEGIPISVVAKEYNIATETLSIIVSKYRFHGEKGLKEVGKHNRSYTIEFKQKVINEYLAGKSTRQLGIEYLISKNVVKNWINQYNKGILKEYDPKGEIYSMRSPKLSKETKMSIAKECIEKGKNYKDICTKYGVKYPNLYSWVIKYEKNK